MIVNKMALIDYESTQAFLVKNNKTKHLFSGYIKIAWFVFKTKVFQLILSAFYSSQKALS